MPTIDDFIRPEVWVSEFLSDMGMVVRKWGEDRYIPIRQQVVEDWQEHKLIVPLMKEVLVYLGVNAAFFPAEAGGTDMHVSTVNGTFDQAALQGLLRRLYSLGLPLISVNCLEVK